MLRSSLTFTIGHRHSHHNEQQWAWPLFGCGSKQSARLFNFQMRGALFGTAWVQITCPMCPPAFNINTLSQRFEPRQLNQQRREEKQINTAKKNAEFGHFRPATANPPIHQSTGKWVSFARAFRANQREIRSRSYATRLDGGGRDHSCNAISMSAKSFTPFFRPHICFLSFGLSKV